MTTLSAINPTSYVDYWSTRIREGMTKTVESIIEVGNTLIACKEQAEHGQFGECLQAAGLSPRVAQMFMKVAANPVIANTNTYSQLPASYNSLYELSRLEGDRLEELVANGTIGPGITYSDVKTLVSRDRTMAANKVLRENPEQGPPAPFHPELGPPAPAIYECFYCGHRVDPSTLDVGDETADIICPDCIKSPADSPPSSWVEKAIHVDGRRKRDRGLEVLRVAYMVINAADMITVVDTVDYRSVAAEDRGGAAADLRKARESITRMIAQLEMEGS